MYIIHIFSQSQPNLILPSIIYTNRNTFANRKWGRPLMPTFLPFSTYFFENVQFVFAFMAFTCTLSPLSMEQTRANIRGSDWKSNKDKLNLIFFFGQFYLFLLGCSILSSSPIDSNAETKLMMRIAIIMMIVIKFPKTDHLKSYLC